MKNLLLKMLAKFNLVELKGINMKKHFVIFFSPGTLLSEQSSESIDSWDVDKAVEMSRKIKERYGATPYGFQFATRERKDDELDSKEIKRSGTYYLGGEVFTLEQIKSRNDPNDRILISNMECNGWDKVVVNTNSWKITQPLTENDTVLEYQKDCITRTCTRPPATRTFLLA